ncbi:hypothetical protein T07_5866 [Trichinella nelsoni]|uniref:Peptidase S1 domain-containing protein n=1 Tax=Trichinella nelsoni TaxID=6336 RepID=A0A0V0RNR8_9BILA|nr:hypothetical protein T07_5866 [Trichinella nelsoni]
MINWAKLYYTNVDSASSIRFMKIFNVNDALASLTTSLPSEAKDTNVVLTKFNKTGSQYGMEIIGKKEQTGKLQETENPVEYWSESEEDMDIFKPSNTDKNMNIGCGDVGQFNLTEEDYFYGRHSFPWTVTILKHQSPLVHCLGILIQSADIQHASNWTQFVLTSSQCFGYNNNDSEKKKKLFYVFIGKYNPRNVSEMIKNSLKIQHIKVYKDSTSRPHITLLKLKTPAILHKNRHPVCLIKTKKLHVAQKCFVSGYNMKTHVVAEYPASLIFDFPCTKDTFRVLENKKGLCSEVKRLRNVKHDGAGLTCFVSGKAHLYGIFSQSFFALTRDRVGLFAEYFTSKAFAKDILKHSTSDNYKNGKHTRKADT